MYTDPHPDTKLVLILSICMVLAILIGGCMSSPKVEEPPKATAGPYQEGPPTGTGTSTGIPSMTPTPSPTSQPTLTPIPTQLPTPVPTSIPTVTPVPSESPEEASLAGQDPFDLLSKRNTLAIVLVLDVSGSMKGNKIEQMKEATIKLLNVIPEYNKVSLIPYATSARVEKSLSTLADKEGLIKKVEMLRPEDSTNIGDGMEGAFLQLSRAQDEDTPFILLLTDGVITAGRSALEVIELARGHPDISISTVAVGGDADKKFLRELAQVGRGRFYDVAEAEELIATFTKEMGEMLSLEELVTYVYLLNVRETLDTIDKDATAESIMKGFDGDHFVIDDGSTSLFFNLICINALKRLGHLDDLPKGTFIALVKSRRQDDGGYAEVSQTASSVLATSSAIRILNYLDTPIENEDAPIEFLIAHWTGRGFKNTATDIESIFATNMAIEALYELDRVNETVLTGSSDFVISQQTDLGGFADFAGGNPHSWYSRMGIEVLRRADRVGEIDAESLKTYLETLKNDDGYSYSPDGETTVGATYDAELTLKSLSAV